jgi:hypothetical protein
MMVAAATGPMPDTYQCHESKRLAETNMEDHPTELDHQWP